MTPAISYPPELPISARRDELLEVIRDHQVVVVAGETGSGKTTQLPKMCLEAGREQIAHTQPRRLAARTVAARIAEEMQVPLGEDVGYAVRFQDRSRGDTRIRLMTDGLLLAEVRRDRLLKRYDTIIVDEAHERSLNIDFLLGYLHRILPRRPDLKLIITSATIDPERFAAHFGDAPVIEVSGRTYPVEVRYRPVEDADRDQEDAIADAVHELQREGPGDVLVFLSGEREIRDTADVLSGRLRSDVEILPLYARLSAAEQQRVFRPHSRRRVVLATNVAETSLTVPGIHYVVDPGTARISRYSARLKVQRLPIEPVSQASADQRKGRCGRTADGICIRLYSEEDFEERPRFTDPEIQRTSLASVILQMAAAGLGDIEDFPFLDPPDRRQVRDGILLLEELGALRDGRLTKLGRRLADLPVDPRMGRMVLEADRLGCADRGHRHRRRAVDPGPARAAVGQDRAGRPVARPVRRRGVGLHLLPEPLALPARAPARAVEQPVPQALPGRVPAPPADPRVAGPRRAAAPVGQGRRDRAQPHAGRAGGRAPRGAVRPAVAPRAQGRARPRVPRGARRAVHDLPRLGAGPEDAGLGHGGRAGRDVAAVGARRSRGWTPRGSSRWPGTCLQRTYSEPRWSASRGSVVATERVTLYGLPIVTDRTVQYGRIDPVLSRELFIRKALVEGEWRGRHDFLDANRALVEEVEALEHRSRRRDILVDDESLVAFYAARIPAEVVSAAHFDRWWRDARRDDPDRLTFTRELLMDAAAAAEMDPRDWPETWRQGDLELRLSYRFDPGAADDGVTVHVPLAVLGQLRADRFEWLVPGLREELVTTLLRGLPKELRRPLVPVPETAAAVLAALRPRRRPLLDDMAEQIERLRGVRVPTDAFDVARLPPHLRVTFMVEDGERGVLAADKSLERVREQVRPRLRAELTAASGQLERSGERSWVFGTLPQTVTLPGTGQAVTAYPALVDEGDTVGVRVLETPGAARVSMAAGTRRLLLLTTPSPARYVHDRLGNAARLVLTPAVLDDAIVAAVDALVAEGGGPAWDEASFRRLRDHVAGSLAERTLAIAGDVVKVLDAAREVERLLDALTAVPLQPARADVREQVRRLTAPGFVAASGAARLPDIERYLRAAARRLERLPNAVAVDRDRMTGVHELERAYRERLQSGPVTAELREVPWMLEELRVHHFAQNLARGGVSAKRIRRALAPQ